MNTSRSQGQGAAPARTLTGVDKSPRIQSLVIATARVVSTICGIFVPIILVRILDQTTFGHYKQFFLVATTGATMFALFLPGSLYYFVPRSPAASQRYMVQSFVLLLAVGATGGTAMLVGAPLLDRILHTALGDEVPWIALYTTMATAGPLLLVAPMVDRRARLASALLVGFDAARSGLVILAALWLKTLTAILAVSTFVMTCQVLAVAVYLIWRNRTGEWSAEPGRLREQLAYALPLAGIGLIGLIRDQLHAFFVAGSFSAAQFAVYAIGTLNIPLVNHITQTLGEVLVLETSANFAAGRREEMQRVWQRVVLVLAIGIIPIFCTLQVFAGDLVTLFYGNNYAAAVPIFRAYLFMLLASIPMLTSPLLRATRDLKVMLVADVVSLSATLAVLMVLVKPLGPIGAVISLVAGNLTFGLVCLERSAKRLGLRAWQVLPWRSLGLILVIGGASALGAWAVVRGWPMAVRLVVGGGISCLLYAAAAWKGGLIPQPEREFLGRLGSQLLRRLSRATTR